MEDNKKPQVEGRAINLIDFIAYQDSSVVSREVLKKETGTVTLFAFDKGQGLSEHTAPFDALVYVMDGAVEIVISGEPHNLVAGEMIIMPANKPHALKAVEKFKMMLVMIKSS
ncbi:MAG: cupin domain-containing protein [Bacillota bacterium]|nr:cupin domain-containing protein [Bacillota bacterium]